MLTRRYQHQGRRGQTDPRGGGLVRRPVIYIDAPAPFEVRLTEVAQGQLVAISSASRLVASGVIAGPNSARGAARVKPTASASA